MRRHSGKIRRQNRRIFGGIVAAVVAIAAGAVAAGSATLLSNTPTTGTTQIEIVSDTGTQAYGPANTYMIPGASGWGTGHNAADAWVHPSWPGIAGAQWISTAYHTEDPVGDSWRWFHESFNIPAGAYDISADVMEADSDNAEEVWFNGVSAGHDGTLQGPFTDNHEWATIKTYDINPVPGPNSLDFVVRNYAQPSGTVTNNPTGIIYKVEITYKMPKSVSIDIKPGSFPNSINRNNGGNVPVAVFSSSDFDATTIDPTTVQFAGEAPLSIGKSPQDVNGDGLLDEVFHFKTKGLDLQANATSACLTGKTFGGVSFIGCDSVRIVR